MKFTVFGKGALEDTKKSSCNGARYITIDYNDTTRSCSGWTRLDHLAHMIENLNDQHSKENNLKKSYRNEIQSRTNRLFLKKEKTTLYSDEDIRPITVEEYYLISNMLKYANKKFNKKTKELKPYEGK